MAKRGPPSKVVAFPIWRGRDGAGPGLVETVEHPDTGEWWIRRSVPQRIPYMENGRRVLRDAWVWTSWVPAKEKPQIDRANWRMRRQNQRPNGRYIKAMLPVELPPIPA